MRFQVLRGFSLGGGIDVFPGQVAEIPPAQRHMIPTWRAQGKLGDEVPWQPALLHRGRGEYDVIDADGTVLLAGVSKAEAEKELAWRLEENNNA